jgi:hypothetical protein
MRNQWDAGAMIADPSGLRVLRRGFSPSRADSRRISKRAEKAFSRLRESVHAFRREFDSIEDRIALASRDLGRAYLIKLCPVLWASCGRFWA